VEGAAKGGRGEGGCEGLREVCRGRRAARVEHGEVSELLRVKNTGK
jgi:hypothetical protein